MPTNTEQTNVGEQSSFDSTKMKAAIDRAISSLVSWQNASQKVLLQVAPHAFDAEPEALEVIGHFLDKLGKYEGRFTMEQVHLTLYLEEIMGMTVVEEEGVFSVLSEKLEKEEARKRYDKMKEVVWYKYRNKTLKEPKAEVNTTNLARSVALGLTTVEDAKAILEKAMASIESQAKGKNVVDWVDKYNAQKAA
jgi:hypothetical protein